MKYKESDIGLRIKEERERLGWSQSELADKCNLSVNSRQTISKWESGKQLPPLNDLLRLCELFKCETGYILCEPGYVKGYKTRAAMRLYEEIGLSELAAENLCIAADSPEDGPLDSTLTEAPHDNLRRLEIGRYAKIRFLEKLLENDDLWEQIAVSAYDYRHQIELYGAEPNHTVGGITHKQFAGVAKEEAKEVLANLFAKIDWDTREWEEE